MQTCAAIPAPPVNLAGQRLRVLVVEDYESLRALLVDVLRDAGFDVVGPAASYEEAIGFVSPPRPDLAVVDLRLGGHGGIEVTRELVKAGVKVLIHTGAEDREVLRAALRAGASGLASKGEPIGDLPGALMRIAAGGGYVSARLEACLRNHSNGVLSRREREVLFVVATGLSNEAAAAELGISRETARTHLRSAMRKLGARNRVHAVALAVARGEIKLP